VNIGSPVYLSAVDGFLVLREIQHWDSPNEAELISDVKRQEIREKIAVYCARRRIPLVVE